MILNIFERKTCESEGLVKYMIYYILVMINMNIYSLVEGCGHFWVTSGMLI